MRRREALELAKTGEVHLGEATQHAAPPAERRAMPSERRVGATQEEVQ